MGFNKEQKEAINIKNKNVLVSAAAGSGKTKVLVEKIARLVCGLEETTNDDEKYFGIYKKVEPISIENILVMTFTKNATNEMKNRIKGRIIELKKEIENGIENKDIAYDDLISYIEYQLSIINNANIQTIDSFCKNLIDTNFSYLEKLDPLYKVADEKEIEVLKNDVLDEILEEKYSDKSFKQFFKCYFSKGSDENLKLIFNIGLRIISKEPFPIKYIDNIIENKETLDNKAINDFKVKVLENIRKEINDYVDKIEKGFDILQDICNDKSSVVNIENISRVEEYIEKIKKLYVDVDNEKLFENIKDYEMSLGWLLIEKQDKKEIIEKIFNSGSIHVVTFDKENSKRYSQFYTPFLNFNKEFLKSNKRFIKNVEKVIDKIDNPYDILYLNILKEYYQKLEEEKLARKIIYISDIQKYAIEILCGKNGEKQNKELLEELQNKYKYIFVDEYQDTSKVQETLINCLSNGYKNKNVFVVGDVKQSIYRFRDAKVEIFQDKFNKYKEQKDSDNSLIVLNQNYRSTEEILKFVNAIFCDVMKEENTGIDYANDGMLKFGEREEKKETEEQKIEREKNEALNKKIDIHLIYGLGNKEFIKKYEEIKSSLNNDDSNEENCEFVNFYEKNYNNKKGVFCYKEDETFYVAHLIKEIHEKYNINYRDITVLLRKEKETILPYKKAMENIGVPCVCELSTGFYDSYEIQLMINILSVIDNPYDDVRLASVLTSCLINITNEELTYLVGYYKNSIDVLKPSMIQLEDVMLYFYNNHENLIKDSINIKKNYEIDIKKLLKKVNAYIDKFKKYREMAKYKSISDIITCVCDDNNLIEKIHIMPLGEIRVKNIEILIDKSKSYETTSFVGLNNFIRYIERVQENEFDDGLANVFDESQDVVRITTIHKSKGLQYKIVILPNLSSNYNNNDYTEGKDRNYVKISDDYGLSLNYADYSKRKTYVTPKRYLLDEFEKKEAFNEEMRVLYVALTRAENKLILINRFETEKTKDEYFEKECEKCNNYQNLMNNAIRNLHTNNEEFVDFHPVNILEYRVKNELEDRKKEKVENDNRKEANKNIDEEEKQLYISPYDEILSLKPKFSVSEIKKSKLEKSVKDSVDYDKYDEKDNLYVDKEDDENNFDAFDMSGADLGTLYHRLMQIIDFNNDDIKGQIENFASKELHLINENAIDLVKVEKVQKLFDSSLGKSLKLASKENRLFREQKFMKYFKQSEIDAYRGEKEKEYNINPDIIVQGIVDAFYIEDVGNKKMITLLDYKTDGINSKKKIKKDDLINRYKVQLDIYEKALKETTGYEINKKLIYSFTLDEVIEL